MNLSPKFYHRMIRPKWFSQHYIRNTINQHFDFHNKTVLDFGCGVGSNTFLFSPKGYIGLDCDTSRINYAKNIYPNYQFIQYKNNKIPLSDASVDYIVILSVLHHIPTYLLNDYMKEFRRILKRNGRIITVEPCFKKHSICNFCMNLLDNGRYIRSEGSYRKIFHRNLYRTKVVKRYHQLLLYYKIMIVATPA